jgi:hypothetical protein
MCKEGNYLSQSILTALIYYQKRDLSLNTESAVVDGSARAPVHFPLLSKRYISCPHIW